MAGLARPSRFVSPDLAACRFDTETFG
ncbi:hypothetical protein A2U01_0115980, partial [Trifolium medium]|nr:hypothetical protein [Trifolium medium]